jgi:hypothetical protein
LTLRTVISNQTPRLIASPGGNAIGVDSFEGCSLGAVRETSGQAPPATMKLVAKCCISLDHAIGTEDTQERRKVRPTLQKNASSAPESRKMTLRRQVNAKTGKRSRRCVFEVRITVFLWRKFSDHASGWTGFFCGIDPLDETVGVKV